MKEDIESYTMENGYVVTKELLAFKGRVHSHYMLSRIVWLLVLVKPYLKLVREFQKITQLLVLMD